MKRNQNNAPAPGSFAGLMEAAPRCGLLFDLVGDCLRYKTIEGRPRSVYIQCVTEEGGALRIRYRNGHNVGTITIKEGHDCYLSVAVAAGSMEARSALSRIYEQTKALASVAGADASYLKTARKPSGKRKEEMKDNMSFVAKLADQAAGIIKNAKDFRDCYKARHIASDILSIAAAGIDTGFGTTAAKHAAAVAEWIDKLFAAYAEETNQAKRPETISETAAAPEAVQETAAPVEQEEGPAAVVMIETTYDIRNGGQSSRRVIYSQSGGLVEIPETVQVL